LDLSHVKVLPRVDYVVCFLAGRVFPAISPSFGSSSSARLELIRAFEEDTGPQTQEEGEGMPI
jgi:hypothetical protein